MKIKTDFVTNSSSSSFVVWGGSLEKVVESLEASDESKLKIYECLIKHALDCSENNKYWQEEHAELIARNEAERISYISEKLEDDSRDLVSDVPFFYADNTFDTIGMSPATLEKYFPDLKFGNVKRFVADKLNEIFGTNFTEEEIGYVEEATYDG